VAYWLDYLSLNISDGKALILLVATKIDTRDQRDLAAIMNQVAHKFVGVRANVRVLDVVGTSAYRNWFVRRRSTDVPFGRHDKRGNMEALRSAVSTIAAEAASKVRWRCKVVFAELKTARAKVLRHRVSRGEVNDARSSVPSHRRVQAQVPAASDMQ
jgi:hypothetical protein